MALQMETQRFASATIPDRRDLSDERPFPRGKSRRPLPQPARNPHRWSILLGFGGVDTKYSHGMARCPGKLPREDPYRFRHGDRRRRPARHPARREYARRFPFDADSLSLDMGLRASTIPSRT